MEWEAERDLEKRSDVVDSDALSERPTSSISDATDDSDYSPVKMAAIRRTVARTTMSAPLPEGVKGVHWVPPEVAGLEHSTAIFERQTASDGSVKTVMNDSQTHFRKWQEDNGVADALAHRTTRRVVDGKLMLVRESTKIVSDNCALSTGALLSLHRGSVSDIPRLAQNGIRNVKTVCVGGNGIVKSPGAEGKPEKVRFNAGSGQTAGGSRTEGHQRVATRSPDASGERQQRELGENAVDAAVATAIPSCPVAGAASTAADNTKQEARTPNNVPHRPASSTRSRTPSPTRQRSLKTVSRKAEEEPVTYAAGASDESTTISDETRTAPTGREETAATFKGNTTTLPTETRAAGAVTFNQEPDRVRPSGNLSSPAKETVADPPEIMIVPDANAIAEREDGIKGSHETVILPQTTTDRNGGRKRWWGGSRSDRGAPQRQHQQPATAVVQEATPAAPPSPSAASRANVRDEQSWIKFRQFGRSKPDT